MMADQEKVTRLLRTAKGQMEGVLKMVEENRYCIDISNQLLATQAILKKVNREILHAHLQHCVRDSLETEEAGGKIDEIMQIMDKISK
ncbi:MAG: metal-sensing transcriptional repressor [Lachnospiraceae bacterium]